MEDQVVTGDTIQVGDTVGRVEQLTLRRTLVRDAGGALGSLSNGTMRSVRTLSRDWSQAFVDIGVVEGIPVEKTLQALERAAAELRGDAAWAPALVDGPRVLGVQQYDQMGATLRLQVRTAPTRQDEVCRELRRRIQIEFQRQGIAGENRGQAGAAGAALRGESDRAANGCEGGKTGKGRYDAAKPMLRIHERRGETRRGP